MVPMENPSIVCQNSDVQAMRAVFVEHKCKTMRGDHKWLQKDIDVESLAQTYLASWDRGRVDWSAHLVVCGLELRFRSKFQLV